MIGALHPTDDAATLHALEVSLPNSYIYVLEEGKHDYSRWMNITYRRDGACIVLLSDLCHPGRLSGITSVTCDLPSLMTAAEGSALQVTLPMGYFLLRRQDDLIHVEFRSHDDAAATKVSLLAEDVLERLRAIDEALGEMRETTRS